MTRFFPLTLFLFFGILTSFRGSNACIYLESNLGLIRDETEKAIAFDDVEIAHYHAYIALNAIEKSRSKFEDCGCVYASRNIEEGLDNLKKATRAKSLDGTRIFLKRALDFTLGSLEALAEHDLHESNFASDMLAMNTVETQKAETAMKIPDSQTLHSKIDKSLQRYKASLNRIIHTVPCDRAKAYAEEVYKHCEAQLLKPDLSEGKKYYNLRTKEITAEALKTLADCTEGR